VTYRKQYITI